MTPSCSCFHQKIWCRLNTATFNAFGRTLTISQIHDFLQCTVTGWIDNCFNAHFLGEVYAVGVQFKPQDTCTSIESNGCGTESNGT